MGMTSLVGTTGAAFTAPSGVWGEVLGAHDGSIAGAAVGMASPSTVPSTAAYGKDGGMGILGFHFRGDPVMDVILQIGTKEVRISAKEFRDLHGLLDKGAAMAEIGTKMAEARKPKSIEITEDEATSLRETASEMEAVQMALEYAMKSAQRRFAELRKQQNDWWEAIGDKYAFDPSRALYEMDKMGSKFLITEKKDSPQQTEATGV